MSKQFPKGVSCWIVSMCPTNQIALVPFVCLLVSNEVDCIYGLYFKMLQWTLSGCYIPNDCDREGNIDLWDEHVGKQGVIVLWDSEQRSAWSIADRSTIAMHGLECNRPIVEDQSLCSYLANHHSPSADGTGVPCGFFHTRYNEKDNLVSLNDNRRGKFIESTAAVVNWLNQTILF